MVCVVCNSGNNCLTAHACPAMLLRLLSTNKRLLTYLLADACVGVQGVV